MTRTSRPARAALLLAALAIALTVSGCAERIGGSSGGGNEINLLTDGELKTCTHLPYPPFQSSKGEQIVGFDVDVIDLVAKDLKVKQTFKDTPFEGIQSGENLKQGDCDLAAAGMTITPERQRVMDFSDPYFEATQALLVKSDSKVKDLGDLRGKTVGVQIGTTGEIYGNDNKQKNGYSVRQFEDLALLQTAVRTGQVDAAINDNGVLFDYVQQNPDTKVTAEFETGEQYGFGVRKGNKALLGKINSVLAEAKKSGEYDKIYRKWFGKAPEKG